MSIVRGAPIVKLFGLFQKSDWEKLQIFPVDVRQDVAQLIMLDSMIKATVLRAVGELQENLNVKLPQSSSDLDLNSAGGAWLPKEVQLAVLSTGSGKEFSALRWSYITPSRVVWALGILAMCEYRYDEKLTNQPDLSFSGYSAYPDEARTQLLIMLAQATDTRTLQQWRVFDEKLL